MKNLSLEQMKAKIDEMLKNCTENDLRLIKKKMETFVNNYNLIQN